MTDARPTMIRFRRDLLVECLDKLLDFELKHPKGDSAVVKEISDNYFNAYTIARDAFEYLFPDVFADPPHAVVTSLPLPPKHEPVPVPATVELPQVPTYTPVTTVAPAEQQKEVKTYEEGIQWFRGLGYPEGQLDKIRSIWQAYDVSEEAGRAAEIERGTWATLSNKKRVMIYKGHAFEPPTDRDYCVPGPLKHLGKYNRAGKCVDPSNEAPVVPQIADAYPWWKSRANLVKA